MSTNEHSSVTAHAAHIHIGSCQSQGAVKYMFIDFIADSHGNIHNQTRVVTGVTKSLQGARPVLRGGR